jgi:hypothetical protein
MPRVTMGYALRRADGGVANQVEPTELLRQPLGEEHRAQGALLGAGRGYTRAGLGAPAPRVTEHGALSGGLDVRGLEAVTDGLCAGGVADREEAVVEALEADPRPLELALGPVMPVDPEADREGAIAGELHERGAEVTVEHV